MAAPTPGARQGSAWSSGGAATPARTLDTDTDRTLVLWDIDNTLLYTGGAGSLGMARAFRDLYGIDDAFRRIEFSGRTDAAIFRDAALAHGVAVGALEAEMARFREAYLPHLEAALGELPGGQLMPGVGELLQALAGRADVSMALGTGNFRAGGEAKLRRFGIAPYFPGTRGGFGDDSTDRARVIELAIERCAYGARRVVVVGDTPHDVSAARANGAYSLAVATGRDSAAALRAAGADAALEDLSDTAAALALICRR